MDTAEKLARIRAFFKTLEQLADEFLDDLLDRNTAAPTAIGGTVGTPQDNKDNA